MTSEWISVKERLPDMKEMYLGGHLTSGNLITFNGHYVSMGEYYETYSKRQLRWRNSTGRVTKVTYWMPLPAPPKEPA